MMNLYNSFVDLEKDFDRVLKEVVRWILEKLDQDEWLICSYSSIHDGLHCGSNTCCKVEVLM